jgi:hypothetical protein
MPRVKLIMMVMVSNWTLQLNMVSKASVVLRYFYKIHRLLPLLEMMEGKDMEKNVP